MFVSPFLQAVNHVTVTSLTNCSLDCSDHSDLQLLRVTVKEYESGSKSKQATCQL